MLDAFFFMRPVSTKPPNVTIGRIILPPLTQPIIGGIKHIIGSECGSDRHATRWASQLIWCNGKMNCFGACCDLPIKAINGSNYQQRTLAQQSAARSNIIQLHQKSAPDE
jgi:hypothetical protein